MTPEGLRILILLSAAAVALSVLLVIVGFRGIG